MGIQTAAAAAVTTTIAAIAAAGLRSLYQSLLRFRSSANVRQT